MKSWFKKFANQEDSLLFCRNHSKCSLHTCGRSNTTISTVDSSCSFTEIVTEMFRKNQEDSLLFCRNHSKCSLHTCGRSNTAISTVGSSCSFTEIVRCLFLSMQLDLRLVMTNHCSCAKVGTKNSHCARNFTFHIIICTQISKCQEMYSVPHIESHLCFMSTLHTSGRSDTAISTVVKSLSQTFLKNIRGFKLFIPKLGMTNRCSCAVDHILGSSCSFPKLGMTNCCNCAVDHGMHNCRAWLFQI